MDKNKFILPFAIIIAAIILGGFYFASIVYQESHIEKEQQEVEKYAETEASSTEKQKQLELAGCIAQVDNEWSNYIESVQGTPQANQFWNGITPAQQAQLDSCKAKFK